MRGRALTATTLAAACSTAVARSSDRAWRVLERSRREADMRERDLGSGFVREDGGAAPGPVLDVRAGRAARHFQQRSEEHTSELQSLAYLVCRLLLEKKKNKQVSR